MEVFGVRVVGPLVPSSTPIPTTNLAPGDSRIYAHARTSLNGGLSLIHNTSGGLDITIWVWVNVLQKWVQILPPGSSETVAALTIADYPNVPPGALIYIQSSSATPVNVWIGNCVTPTGEPFPTPTLP